MAICLCEDFRRDHPDYLSDNNNTNQRVSMRYNYIVSQIQESIAVQSAEPSSYANYMPTIAPASIVNTGNMNRLNQINTMRRQPINTRVRDVFIEIDRLGLYTNQEWFNSLSHLGFANLYRILYNLWNFRAGIPNAMKLLICPFHSPFDGIFPRETRHDELSLVEIKTACVIVFENMIYSGVDDEYRKIGTFHALSALTIVSREARAAMPWLYESVV
jgi:hypothetical protein